jgi:hypothetical protein
MTKRVNSYDPNARLPGVGGIYVWELDQPHARDLIEVTEVFWNGEEWWVRTKTLMRGPDHMLFGVPCPASHLNDLSHFWEAVTPVRETRTPRPSLAAKVP